MKNYGKKKQYNKYHDRGFTIKDETTEVKYLSDQIKTLLPK